RNAATLTEGVLKAMALSTLKGQTAVLFALACVGGTVTLLPPVAGQPPVAVRKDGNAKLASGGQGETDKDRLQGKWQIMSIAMEEKVIKREDRPVGWEDTFN